MADKGYKEKRIVVGFGRSLPPKKLDSFMMEMGFLRKPSQNTDWAYEVRTYVRAVNGTRAFVIYHDSRYRDDVWERTRTGLNVVRSQLVVKIEGLTSAKTAGERELYWEQESIAKQIGEYYRGIVYDEGKREVIGEPEKVVKPRKARVEKKSREGKERDPEEEREWKSIRMNVVRLRRRTYNVWTKKHIAAGQVK